MGAVLVNLFTTHGLYEMVQIDNKCLTMRGLDADLLKKLGVGILRSNHCSRHQGIVERMIKTVRLKS